MDRPDQEKQLLVSKDELYSPFDRQSSARLLLSLRRERSTFFEKVEQTRSCCVSTYSKSFQTGWKIFFYARKFAFKGMFHCACFTQRSINTRYLNFQLPAACLGGTSLPSIERDGREYFRDNLAKNTSGGRCSTTSK